MLSKTLLAGLLLAPLASLAQQPLVDSRTQLKEAYQLVDDDKYKQAVAVLNKINRSDTNYSKALSLLVRSHFLDSAYETSHRLCLEGQKQFPELRQFWITNLANNLDRMGKSQEALRLYDSLLTLAPYHYESHYNKAVTYAHMEDLPSAIASMERCLRINPYYAKAHYFYGALLYDLGEVVPATMALMTSLILEPSHSQNRRAAMILSQLANMTDGVVANVAKNKKKAAEFEEANELFVNKVALNEQYKTRSNINDPIIRQVQMIMEKLPEASELRHFAAHLYVPYFQQVWKQDLFQIMVARSFADMEIAPAVQYSKSHSREETALKTMTGDYFEEIRQTQEVVATKRSGKNELYYLWQDNTLRGKGPFTQDSKGKIIPKGVWSFYYDNGNLSGTGQFDDAQRNGLWKYYYEDGIPKSEVNLRNGEEEGQCIYYHQNGLLGEQYTVRNGKLEGPATFYHFSGVPKLQVSFANGKKQGPEKSYNDDGRLRYTTAYEAGAEVGTYTTYHPNGKPEGVYQYVAGKLQGPVKVYNAVGKLVTEGSFANDKRQGQWTSYHFNGQKSEVKNYDEGLLEGNYQSFHVDGSLKEEANYSKGKLNGLVKNFNRQKKQYAETEYERGKLREMKFFDAKGNEISSVSTRRGGGDMTIYDEDGRRFRQGSYDKNGNRNGDFIDYFPGGDKSFTGNYVNDEANGEHKYFFSNGQVKSVQPHKKGELDGYARYFKANGNKSFEGWFVQGQRQGPGIEYNVVGDLESEYYYLNDNPINFNLTYNPGGRLSTESLYKNGWYVGGRQYDSTGKKVLSDYLFTKGKGEVVFKRQDGTPYYNCPYEHYRQHGKSLTLFPNGKLETERYFDRGEEDSTFRSYWANGNKRTSGRYVAGKKEGSWQWFYPSGQLQTETFYVMDEEQGLEKHYNADGSLDRVYTYANGDLDGPTTFYAEAGKVAIVWNYVDDELKTYSYEGADGKLVPAIAIPKGKGLIKAFFPNGKVSAEVEFDNNVNNGKRNFYFSNGQPHAISQRVDGSEMGKRTIYYPNGVVQTEEINVLNTNHGPRTLRYPNGKLMAEEMYYDDSLHGTQVYYNETGKPVVRMKVHHGMAQTMETL